MVVNFHKVNLKKKHPLQISRGIHDKSQNLFLEIIKDGITAWGESAPGKTEGASNANEVEEWLLKLSESHCSDFVAKSSIEADITYSQAEEILWVIPENYVNNSGRTVSKLLKNINLPNNKIIIFLILSSSIIVVFETEKNIYQKYKEFFDFSNIFSG